MKTFSRTYLPETIKYNGEIYHKNAAISGAMNANNTSLNTIAASLKKEGRKAILVNCLAQNLKGKTDLHGKLYQPTRHIYTTESAKLI